MDWTRIILATLVSGIASVLTDWFFLGFLFHEKYKTYPEIWRSEGGPTETKAIVLSSFVGFLTCFCFVLLCSNTAFNQWIRTWKLAVLLWFMIPIPILVMQYQWMKMHPLTLLAHALGWLAKLLLAAGVVAWLIV